MAPTGATTTAPSHSAADSSAHAQASPAGPTTRSLRRNATDDEILGITYGHRKDPGAAAESSSDSEENNCSQESNASDRESLSTTGDPGLAEAEPEELRGVLDANPKLRSAWDDAQAYRKVFATPEEARTATALLADLNRMDALFFSQRPEDHMQLAHTIAELDPTAFASLARAINAHLGKTVGRGQARNGAAGEVSRSNVAEAPRERPEVHRQEMESQELNSRSARQDESQAAKSGFSAEETEFFHAANASAVEGVLEAIESQVERLLPEGVSKNARGRVVAEIYRELDATLRSNRQLAQQLREAFRSGSLDADHQRAVVSLISGRARQALPGVAKRVLQEWTSTLVAANQDRRARQRSAERRVDIAGSGGTGSDGRRSIGPRSIDYARMSDADILNL